MASSQHIYNFRQVENKWRDFLNSNVVSNEDIKNNPHMKEYVLVMLPYPSGKLHMGHVRNYTIGDVISRYKKMQGKIVIQPMGWDSFGMPAENAALATGGHPKEWTNSNIQEMKKQLIPFGYMYDWSREISTCSEEYYSKEQQIFIDMLKHGLVYRKKSYVNWDPVDQTVLANEQVIDGRGWRSGALVERKMLEQWSIKITHYADKLLDGLKELEGFWPEKVLKMQENWIGRSNGALIHFDVIDRNLTIDVFSTRPDTLFGASFIAISPDHAFAAELAKTNLDINAFIEDCKKTANTEETLEKLEKNGIFTGFYAQNPLKTEQKLPIYIANFVLIDYGTGAVFGCPAHDERDFEFAKKYDLGIVPVIETEDELPYVGEGTLINSSFLNGLSVFDAKLAAIAELEKLGKGRGQTTYRLRDWLVSRQRYWGCPIPIIHCPKCGSIPAKLPVLLPDDVVFDGKGNPLENHPTWKHVECHICKEKATRDTDTLDTFFESSWYFLRYISPDFKSAIDKEMSDIMMPVDLCIGGVEHAVMHLLYARFFMLALRDMGYISSTDVPFKRLLTQGMVCHKSYKNSVGDWVYPDEISKLPDGKMIDKEGLEVFECSFEKMSKSKKNTISPDVIINSHGVDAVRLFIVSDTPPEKDFDWNTDALDGSWRFLNKVWKIFNKTISIESYGKDDALIKISHIYMKKIQHSYDTISLNKTVAFVREFFNAIEGGIDKSSKEAIAFAIEAFIKMIYPIIPHIAHEMWEMFGKNSMMQDEKWPIIDEKLADIDVVTVAVQVNGKLRATFEIAKDSQDDALKNAAILALHGVIEEQNILKSIVVKNKIVNFVVK